MSDSQVDLAQAEAHVMAGDLDGARAIAEAMLAADPTDAGAHNVLGFIAHRELRLLDAKREFELAGNDEDARANLATVEAQIAAMDNAHADFSCTVEDLAGGLLGPDVSPRLLGLLCSQPFDEQLEARVNQLPSAASANERRFLLRFAGRLWDGDGDVFENGPLLGGTTRGLALGMLANPRRREGALLQTHDWFSSRVPLDLPPNVWEHLVAHGLITQDHVAEMERSGSFQALYDHLHSGQDYSPLVRSHEAYLPGHRGDVPAHGEAVYRAPEGREFSLVFVDGCKSWYGTKHWLVETCQAIRPGSHVVFQDYGWYTCFWLPALHAVLEDHFRLVAYVDDTYAFQLVNALDPATVEERFPDTPAEFGRDAFDDTFLKLGIDAGVRSDVHAMVSLTIQHAGALAYIGLLDEAREHIAGMLGRPEFFPFRARFIAPALESPTYTPDGPIRL
jgi:hypothetical protein